MPITEDDRQRLIGFVYRTADDITLVLETGADYLGSDLHGAFGAAWEDLQRQKLLADIEHAIASGNADEAIERHALTGQHLRFKLALIDEAREDITTAGRPTPRLLRRLLKRINVPLKSLLAAVGAGEAMQELKEGLENELEEAEAARHEGQGPDRHG